MQTRVSKHFVVRLVALAIFALSLLGPRAAVQAAPAQQTYTCSLSLSGPYRSGSSVAASASVSCSGPVGPIFIQVSVKAPNGTVTQNGASCYPTGSGSAGSCSANVSAPLAEGAWSATASGSYYSSNGQIYFTPITYSASFARAYYLKLTKIVCLHNNDDTGADEPRLYVNGVKVWSSEHFDDSESAALTYRVKYTTNTSFPIVLKEYDAWPGYTLTMNPNPHYAYKSEVGTTKEVEFLGGGAIYRLSYTVAYEW